MTVAMRTRPEATIVSDASGNWGCRAYSSKGERFQFQWPSSWATIHITVLLCPVRCGAAPGKGRPSTAFVIMRQSS